MSEGGCLQVGRPFFIAQNQSTISDHALAGALSLRNSNEVTQKEM